MGSPNDTSKHCFPCSCANITGLKIDKNPLNTAWLKKIHLNVRITSTKFLATNQLFIWAKFLFQSHDYRLLKLSGLEIGVVFIFAFVVFVVDVDVDARKPNGRLRRWRNDFRSENRSNHLLARNINRSVCLFIVGLRMRGDSLQLFIGLCHHVKLTLVLAVVFIDTLWTWWGSWSSPSTNAQNQMICECLLRLQFWLLCTVPLKFILNTTQMNVIFLQSSWN